MVERARIVPLADLRAPDAGAYGRKAAMLGELAAAGFRVPDGFALPATCFDAFLRANGFPYGPAEYAARPAAVRAAIESYTFPEDLLHSLADGVAALLGADPAGRLVARTSALCEDRRASSLAGVFRSFAGLRTPEEVREAVRGCYLSAFSDGVLHRHAEGLIEDGSLKAGVIVQRWVEGEVSGVTFTADTAEMDPTAVRISAGKGPCSGITDGSAPATTWVCDKATGAVRKVFGAPEVLGPEDVTRLVRSARAIEDRAGYYQDIEWTLCGDEVCILQSRPVTGFREPSPASEWPVPGDGTGKRRWRRPGEGSGGVRRRAGAGMHPKGRKSNGPVAVGAIAGLPARGYPPMSDTHGP